MSLINLHEFTHHLINHHQLSFMLDKRRKLLSIKKKKKEEESFYWPAGCRQFLETRTNKTMNFCFSHNLQECNSIADHI